MITNYEAAAAILSYYNLPNCPFNAESRARHMTHFIDQIRKDLVSMMEDGTANIEKVDDFGRFLWKHPTIGMRLELGPYDDGALCNFLEVTVKAPTIIEGRGTPLWKFHYGDDIGLLDDVWKYVSKKNGE